jgi:hypothetical protein
MTNQTLQDRCFDHLIGAMRFFVKDEDSRQNFCQNVPEIYMSRCLPN